MIAVEHGDHLAWFGFEHLRAALSATGRPIVVVDDIEVEDGLVRDVTEVLASLCVRLYGRRSVARRAEAALAAVAEVPA